MAHSLKLLLPLKLTMNLESLEASRPSKRFSSWKRPSLEHGRLNEYNWLVLYPEGLQLADYVDVGAFCLLQARSGIVVEKDVQLGSHCAVYSESTIDGKKGKIFLKENSRIGSHCTIMPGVTVGRNSVVGANSFVNKSIPEGEVWAGVPARFIKKLE